MGKHQFQFKQFLIEQEHCAMKVSTDSCLFGAWVAHQVSTEGYALDIGAGTGLLSLMVAQSKPKLSVDAIEIEKTCYAQMTKNIMESPWNGQIKPILGDIRNFKSTHKYHVIISNPPFYERQLESTSQEVNLARHGHSLSLVAFFEHANRLLHNSGDLFVLMPHYRFEEVIKVASRLDLHAIDIITVKHSKLHSPFRNMFRFRKDSAHSRLQTLVIRDENGGYTEEFKALLQPYYLHL